MKVTLEEFMKDFTPQERAQVAYRRVVKAGELTDEEVALISIAEVPAEHAHLDEELKDWLL